jgi:signal transduction histidine kinase
VSALERFQLPESKFNPLRPQFFKPSLQLRLVAIMLFTSLCLVSILVVFYYQTEKALFNEFERRTAELSKAVQIGLKSAAGKNLSDTKSLEEYLSSLNPKGIKEISVISSADRIIASTKKESVGKWITERRKEMIFMAVLGEPVTGDGLLYNVVIPVSSDNVTAGYIHLTLNTEDFSVFLRLNAIRRTIAALVVIGFGTLLAVVLAGRYIRPIKQVVGAAGKVAGGDLSQELPTERQDEIGELSRSFNYMVERLRDDRDLKERLRTAEHLASVGQFAKSIAHEIKNPLNFISLSIDHMREIYRPADPAKTESFDSLVLNIKGEIQRISRFAESFLEYGKPFELRRRKMSLDIIVDSVLELAMAKAQQGNISIVREYDRLPEISLDPEFIRTCLYNIVLNAFEAMPRGGTLTIRSERSTERLSLSFADSGVGVEKDKLDKVFEPFFTTKSRGLGLGLALTRKVIEEHGGKVQFDSIPGKGSNVTLQFPLLEEQRG